MNLGQIKRKLYYGNEKTLQKQQFFNGIVYYSALKEMEQELNSIDYVIIKGEPLSMLAYGSFGCRTSHDIDILIDRKNVSTLNQILNRHGFYQLNRDLSRLERIFANQAHQTFSYIKKVSDNTVVVDVNVDIFGENMKVRELIFQSLYLIIKK